MIKNKYCGFITIIGRTNVGKSTLINNLIGKKISITSKKPKTTISPIIGINTKNKYQSIYIDTPGIYKKKGTIINLINCSLIKSIKNIFLLIFVVEINKWKLDDYLINKKIKNFKYPIIVVINKIDTISKYNILLPYIKFISKKINFYKIIPISAKNGTNLNILSNIINKLLPKKNHIYPSNYITDQSTNFIISEIIREKLIRFLGDELPYNVMVKVENLVIDNSGNYNIYAFIFTKRKNQKKIIIGYKGNKIKNIGIKSREEIESIINKKVNLKLWVKVMSNHIKIN